MTVPDCQGETELLLWKACQVEYIRHEGVSPGPSSCSQVLSKWMENDIKPRQARLPMAQTPEEWVCSLPQARSFNQLTTYWGQRKYRLSSRVFKSIHGHRTDKETRTLRLRVFLPHSFLNVSGFILANSFLLFLNSPSHFPITQIKVLTISQKRQSDWRANWTSPKDWWRISLREELEYLLLFRKQHHGRQKDNLAVVFFFF